LRQHEPAVPPAELPADGRRADRAGARRREHRPPGDYMLFIVNSNGVPCVAPFVRFAAPYEDSVPPTAPANLAASGGLAAASLSWSAATDNNVVKTYNVYRSATSGFTPAAQNLVGSSATTTF